MTINLSDNDPRVSYSVAEGVTQSSFTVSFEFFDDDDLNVYVDGTLKTLTTDYTVSGGDGSTGTVTISVTGATGGSTVVITRDIDLDRTTDFPSSGPFNIGSLNTELDRFVAIAADLNDRASRSLQLSDYDTSVTVVLPDVNDRKGTVLAFNETTGAVEAGPTTSNVNTLAAVTDDIATLADIEDGTDATDTIQTVAGIASNVTTVAGVSANVTTVAGISSDVTTVAGISSDTTTVAGISSNVTTVAGISSDVTTAAGISANITTVAGDSADIQSLAAVSTEIGLLGTADAIADMNTLATSAIVTDMDALANLTTEIDALGDVTADITTVSGISANVTTVAGVSANVTTVAGISGNVTTVAGVSSDVTTVAGISANVTTVAGDTTNIATIATDLTGSDNIGTVAGSISNVNLVGGSIANVNTVATNLSGVNSFAERYRVGASDPTTSLDEGDLFFNTTSNAYKFYDGSAWQTVNVSGIGSVADDATPQLGGNLDLNSNDITGTGNISITGEVTADAINLGDNDEITLGTTRSLRMYNNGINSYIVNEPSGFGDLNIYSTDDILFYHGTTASAELMLGLYSDNAVVAYYDGTEKLRTSSGGIDVSGYVYTDGGLVHNGDTDTNIQFSTNTQVFYTGNSERLKLDSSGVEINNAYHLPTSDGTSGQVMQTNGSGTVSFVDAASGGGSFSATAYEALTAGDPVYMRNDGKVGKTFAHSTTDSTVNAGISFSTSWNYRVAWDTNGSRFVLVGGDTGSSNNFYAQAFTVSGGTVTAGTKTFVYTTGASVGNYVDGIVDTGDGLVAILRNREEVVVARLTGTGTTISVGTTSVVETSTADVYNTAFALNSAKDTLFVVAQDSGTTGNFGYLVSISGTSLTVGSGYNIGFTITFGAFYDSTSDRFVSLSTSENTSTSMQSRGHFFSYSGTTLTLEGYNIIEDFDFGTSASPVFKDQYYSEFVEVDGINYALKYNYGVNGSYMHTDLVGFANGSDDSTDGYIPRIVTRISMGVTNEIGSIGAARDKQLFYSSNMKQLVVPQSRNATNRGIDMYTVFDMTTPHNPVKSKVYSFAPSTGFADDTCVAVNPVGNNEDNLIISWDGSNANVYTWNIPTDISCIGIAQATVSADASVDIAITGGVSDVHSSLTAGYPYYANGATVSQTSGGKQLGYSISTTEIAMTGG